MDRFLERKLDPGVAETEWMAVGPRGTYPEMNLAEIQMDEIK